MSVVGPWRVVDERTVERAVRWHQDGVAVGVIAADLGVSRRTVYRYLAGDGGRFETRIRRIVNLYPGSIDDRDALTDHLVRALAHRP